HRSPPRGPLGSALDRSLARPPEAPLAQVPLVHPFLQWSGTGASRRGFPLPPGATDCSRSARDSQALVEDRDDVGLPRGLVNLDGRHRDAGVDHPGVEGLAVLDARMINPGIPM